MGQPIIIHSLTSVGQAEGIKVVKRNAMLVRVSFRHMVRARIETSVRSHRTPSSSLPSSRSDFTMHARQVICTAKRVVVDGWVVIDVQGVSSN